MHTAKTLVLCFLTWSVCNKLTKKQVIRKKLKHRNEANCLDLEENIFFLITIRKVPLEGYMTNKYKRPVI